VRIGNSLCNVTSLSRQQLTCRPPVTQPPGVDEDGRPNPQELPQVVVSSVDTETNAELPVLSTLQNVHRVMPCNGHHYYLQVSFTLPCYINIYLNLFTCLYV